MAFAIAGGALHSGFRPQSLASKLTSMKARRIRHDPPRIMTLKEWNELPDDVPGELVDGVLEEDEAVWIEGDLGSAVVRVPQENRGRS